MKDLEIDERDSREQPVLTRQRVCREDAEREDQVEVEAADVREESAPPSKSVRVRDVGEEDGVDEVEAEPHPARSSAGDPKRGRMSELVEHGRAESHRAERGHMPGLENDGL